LRISIALIIALIITGCAQKKPKPGKKSITNEDVFIIKALFYENENELPKAIQYYRYLYDHTKKDVYFQKIISDLFYLKKYDDVLVLSEEYLQKRFDKKVFMYRILSLVELNRLKEAKKELTEKYNKKSRFFYRMMAFINIKEKNYKKAADYLKSLYAIDHSKATLLQLTDVLIKEKKYNEALAYLRTHLDLYGCEYDVCVRLAVIYKQTYDYENLAVIYEKMSVYDQKYLMFAFRIYLDNGEYDKALKLINKYRLGDEYTLIVYETKKDFKKAAFFAKKLYEKSAKLAYLFKYCTYEYEANPGKKTAERIIPHLKYLIKFYPSAYLYNFLGYLLIDYDIDVKEGLKYVQKAVELKPENEEYIDSLAWGYYKIGKCKEAWEIIKYVKLKDKEILKHKKMIKKCLKDQNDTR